MTEEQQEAQLIADMHAGFANTNWPMPPVAPSPVRVDDENYTYDEPGPGRLGRRL